MLKIFRLWKKATLIVAYRLSGAFAGAWVVVNKCVITSINIWLLKIQGTYIIYNVEIISKIIIFW